MISYHGWNSDFRKMFVNILICIETSIKTKRTRFAKKAGANLGPLIYQDTFIRSLNNLQMRGKIILGRVIAFSIFNINNLSVSQHLKWTWGPEVLPALQDVSKHVLPWNWHFKNYIEKSTPFQKLDFVPIKCQVFLFLAKKKIRCFMNFRKKNCCCDVPN